MAGEFESVLDIKAADFDAIAAAVNQVVDSYARKFNQDGRNEILVQEMVRDVAISGVLFTCEPNHGAPYYVINYDDVSGLTTTVTAGIGSASNKLLYVYRDALDSLKSPRFLRLVSAVVELERVLDCQLLDVEFAIDESETPILLQVRRITTHETLDEELTSDIERRIVEWSLSSPALSGQYRASLAAAPSSARCPTGTCRDHRSGAKGPVDVPVSRADHEQSLEGSEVRDGLSRARRATVDGFSRRAALHRRQAELEFLPP